MITKLLVLLTFGLGSFPALAFDNASILGQWQYDGFFYEGNRYPNPNPDLELFFTFRADGTDRLYYARKNETGGCERIASYSVTDSTLTQTVTWVSPSNLQACGQDVDMQMGRMSVTEFHFSGQELWLHLDLNGKPFMYILKFIPEVGSTPVYGPQ